MRSSSLSMCSTGRPAFWNLLGSAKKCAARSMSPRSSAASQRRMTRVDGVLAGPVARSGTFVGTCRSGGHASASAAPLPGVVSRRSTAASPALGAAAADRGRPRAPAAGRARCGARRTCGASSHAPAGPRERIAAPNAARTALPLGPTAVAQRSPTWQRREGLPWGACPPTPASGTPSPTCTPSAAPRSSSPAARAPTSGTTTAAATSTAPPACGTSTSATAASEIVDAAAAQMRTLASYSAFGAFANTPALRLAERLAELAPVDDARIFFGSGGGDAIDTAGKLARRYFAATGHARARAPHQPHAGLPRHARARHEHRRHPRQPRRHGPARPERLARPARLARGARGRDRARRRRPGRGGVRRAGHGRRRRPPAAAGLRRGRRRRCARGPASLFVVDAVINGFGRLGTWFAADRFGVRPDMICFAKGITSGYLPLGGVVDLRPDRRAVLGARRHDVPPRPDLQRAPDVLRGGDGEHGHHAPREPPAARDGARGRDRHRAARPRGPRARRRGPRGDRRARRGRVRARGARRPPRPARSARSRRPAPAASSSARSATASRSSPPLVVTREEVDHAAAVIGESLEAIARDLPRRRPRADVAGLLRQLLVDRQHVPERVLGVAERDDVRGSVVDARRGARRRPRARRSAASSSAHAEPQRSGRCRVPTARRAPSCSHAAGRQAATRRPRRRASRSRRAAEHARVPVAGARDVGRADPERGAADLEHGALHGSAPSRRAPSARARTARTTGRGRASSARSAAAAGRCTPRASGSRVAPPSVGLERERAHALEQAERHPARSTSWSVPRLVVGDLDREGAAGVRLRVDLDRLARRDRPLDPVDARVPRGVGRRVGQDRPDRRPGPGVDGGLDS